MLSNLDIFGRIFIFTTFLPGLVGGCAIFILFYDDLQTIEYNFSASATMNTILFVSIVYFLGFIANALGHGIEVIIRKRFNKSKIEDPFTYFDISISSSKRKGGENILKSMEYSENLRAWYWNSSIIIIIILLIKAVFYFKQRELTGDLLQVIIFIVLLITTVLLFCVYWHFDKLNELRINDFVNYKLNVRRRVDDENKS